MKHRTQRFAKRWLALILCLCMIFPSAVTLVSAAEEPAYTGGLCEHHPEHTPECGYAEAAEGQPCNHVHDESCGYSEPIGEIPCAHSHDESCGYQAAVAEIPCDKGCTNTDENGNIIHQEGCAYQPAVEEQPCTHEHDENCGYQATVEGSHCTHVHSEACGYVETVEGKPCTFVCEICSGEKKEQDTLDADDTNVADNIEIAMTNPVGYVGQEYNLLEKATVTPEKDGNDNPIKLRITDLKADPTDTKYEWNSPVLKVMDNQNVVFTVTYEAYVELEDTDTASESGATEKVLATQELTFNIYATGEIGEKLDGDYAYISDAYLVEDEDTESKLAIRTGTAPWDDDNSAGNDSSELNNTVRSFDVVTYTAAFKTQVRDDGPYTAYKTGTVYYEFLVEGSEDLVRFETESMGWMTAKTDGTYTVAEETRDGKTYQVLRGSFLAEPADGNPAAIGNSYQELNIALRVLAMTQGEKVTPKFTFWLEGNDVPREGFVTDSSHSCPEHNEMEYKTITAPDVSVTSAPRFNVKLTAGANTLSYVDTFDFSTGNEDAANKDIGTKEGRAFGYGITLQIQGKSPQHGLRGCELPDGSDITLDLDLSSIYRTDKGEEENLFDDYPLLLWSIDGQRSSLTQSDGRLINGILKYVPGTSPANAGANYSGCYDGGTWKAAQTDNIISITVSGYQVYTDYFPYANIGTTEIDYSYYDPNKISHYWEIQNACFSAGEIWLVQPFYNEDDEYIADGKGNGTFSTTVQDVSLNVTGKSGTALPEVTDNSNQVTTEDDRSVVTVFLSRSGTISANIAYLKYGKSSAYDLTSLTENCIGNGKDWVLSEGKLAISAGFSHANAEGVSTGVAYDTLIKFDDTFFQPDGTYQLYDPYYSTGKVTVLFGAKKDKAGWNHSGKSPHEAGYDAEMMETTADDLLFFSSLDELKNAGYTCVAALAECRGIYSTQRTGHFLIVNGTVNPDAQSGSVYMCTIAAKGWNKADVQEAAAKYLNKDAGDLTDEDFNTYVQSDEFPSRADEATPPNYTKDYPSSFWTYDYANVDGLKNYKKSTYDENGFDEGTAGSNAGDSCLVVDYATQITKSPNQPGTGESGKKLTYDMDTNQREVDYVLYPTAIRAQGESTTEGTSTTTTVYIEDTLPAGLEYILNSAFYGGTYTSNGGGRAGTVTGGQRLLPAITPNADGTTTLLFTLKDVTITEEEVTTIDPIYYSCLIGTPGNEETDVVNQQQLVNSVKIWSDDEQIRDFVATNGNYAEQSILISKNRGVSFSKTSDQKIVDVGDEMGFTIHHGNNSSNSMDVVDIDFLPHNEDGRGTQITGQVVVSELTIQSKELISGFKLYYTTDTSKRNTTAAEYQASDFTEENGWTEMEIDPDTGAVELPDLTHVIVAVAAVGRLTPNSTLKMHISFEVPDGKPGEFLVNSFGSGDMESNARTYIVNRLLEGVVWLDTDKDGLRESGEALIDGVKVTLMQKGQDGTYQPYLLDGKAVSVETGKQINVLTGEISDNTRGTGAYGFHHLPQGDFAVQFESGETVKLGDYTATQENVGTNDTIDSDATAQEQDGKLVSARIEGIEMPEAKKITVQTYESRYHDLGLYASQINIPVEKVWDDNNNQDNKRPGSVTVALYANGNSTGQTLTLSEANGWKGTFENLDEFLDGEKIDYTVKEGPVNGYTTNITESPSGGFTITNSYTPETITISGSKTWDDKDNQDGKRPDSITIRLYANGTELTEKALTVTADNDWNWSFTDLPKYAEGKLITYTITEDSVDGYTSAVNGYDVTNTYSPEQTSITVTKAWADNDNQDGLRPESVTVKLLADGQETNKTLTLSSDNNWQGSFSGLDKYREGKEISYSVAEVSVTGYETEISGSSSTGFTITNTHTPETITLSGSKTWNDNNNQDGKRPSSITIRLYANGAELKDKALTVTADNGWTWNFDNLPKYANGKEITYTISEDVVEGYTPAYDGLNVTNTYTPEQTSVTVTKAWADNDNQDGKRPESITVKLLADGQETKKTLTLSSGNNWTGTFTGLDKYQDGQEIAYTIEEVDVNGYSTVVTGDASTGFTITNSYTPETISISGSKTWDDANDQDGKRPESITVSLLADGSKVSEKEVTASDNWTWTFENLPKYKDGKLINYTIQEEAVPGYTLSYSGYNVTNSYTPGKVAIPVTKSWQDNNDQDGLRPQSVTVKLLADGKDTGKTLILSEGNGWSGTFTGLDEYAAGEKIAYTVEEVSVNGYDTAITGDASNGFTITNAHNPETITLSGAKTWNDADNQDGKRPDSITIRLYANGTELKDKAVTVTADDGWKWNFAGLPKYADGKEITYTISEDAVNGYTPAYTDFDVTNTYTPEQTSITVTKAWADNNDQDGLRPESITVKLLADGADTKETLTLSSGNNWTGTFNNLDKYRDGGEEIVYTIEEVEVSGYDTVISGDVSKGFVITNSHTPATTEVSGSKTWDDANDQDGKRPDSITIRLYANGKQVDTKTVTAKDDWKWSFTNLPKYADGKEITYTITEDTVPGYTSEVDGYNVTNSYTPGKTSVTVTKAWNDAGNQDGLRPAEITVKLLADGKDTGKTLTLSKENRWMGIFTDLDEYKDGQKIVYTVEEVSVKGYDSVITGDASTGFVITNSHTPEEIDLSGAKTWDDADNQDGKRPESITIRLYANGEQVEVVTVTAKDGWKWSFANLPKYESGSEIRYTITEDAVSGYQSEVNGMDVTNHYTPGKINIPVTKNWQDKNDADGIRPDSITVKLYADGKDTGKELVLDQGNNWAASFDDLDEYAGGVKISYTIAEVEVDGYDTSISGSAETGFVINNSHTPDTPDKPDDPDDPDEPGKPTDPDDPDEPTTPTDPDEPDKPNPPKDDTPQTGDTTNLALWIGLLAISATGFTATLVLGKKKRYRGKHMR